MLELEQPPEEGQIDGFDQLINHLTGVRRVPRRPGQTEGEGEEDSEDSEDKDSERHLGNLTRMLTQSCSYSKVLW